MSYLRDAVTIIKSLNSGRAFKLLEKCKYFVMVCNLNGFVDNKVILEKTENTRISIQYLRTFLNTTMIALSKSDRAV